MGLSICVGLLAELADDEEGAEWLRESIECVNEVLVANGLPPHAEPEAIDERSRCGLDGFSYSWLHMLRRAYAHAVAHPASSLVPLEDDEDPTDDDVLRALEGDRTHHLLFHSDTEGYYVPVDFPSVLVDESIDGEALGSTPRLMNELVRVARLLGIRLRGRELPDEEADAINAEVESPSRPPLWRERIVWLALFEAARISLQTGAAVVFQ